MRSKRGVSYAHGKTRPRTSVKLRLTRCARSSRLRWRVSTGRNGKFTRRLGRSKRLRGCLLKASIG